MPGGRELLTWNISERLKETIWKEIGSAEQWEELPHADLACRQHTLICCV